MAAINQNTQYAMESPYSEIRNVMCLRNKSQGEVILWEPVVSDIIACQIKMADFHKKIVKLNKGMLLSVHKELNEILSSAESELKGMPNVDFREINYRIQLEKLFVQIREIAQDAHYLATADEPDENSIEFKKFLSEVVVESMSQGKSIAGKKSLMALFD
ncbi:hypothetical protein [Spirosoma sp.]|uniref:hypothetical protein n=1 Tax=Spirosoma sp. TaxID=1899569 RepID=UPI00263A2F02|nr:hypothetical protein [Spirosoma sp.]MCX6213516.1 hypothetical protein [Spirosoma sp.]